MIQPLKFGRSKPVLSAAHVIGSIAPQGGGPSISVPALCSAIAAEGCDVRLHTTDASGRPRKMPTDYDVRLHACYPHAFLTERFMFAPSLHRALVGEARHAHIVHSHGLWLWPSLDAYWATRGGTARLVISIRGMLEPYARNRSPGRKRIVWMLGQRAALHAAACLHATAESEYDSIRALGFRNPITIVPNGVDVPPFQAELASARRRLLFLGRLDQKKGIDLLLRAWAQIEREFPSWELCIVGPSSGDYGLKMRALAAELAAPRVLFLPPAYAEERDRLMADATMFVLPTRSENFGMAVAEALGAGLAVICTKGAPWQELEQRRCGFWIDIGVEPLVACLRNALSLPDEQLRAMGQRGRRWMTESFSWEAQGRRMFETYEWLVGRSPRPACVRTD